MNKRIIFTVVLIFIIVGISGCGNGIQDIEEEQIETFDVEKADEESNSTFSSSASLDEKMNAIDFYLVSDVYSRNVMQDDMEIFEMFALDRSNFVRIATSDLEREVYAYDYVSDDFTYLYYFDGDLTSKTVVNVGTGAVLEDEDGYASKLSEEAIELKEYFYALLSEANMDANELIQ